MNFTYKISAYDSPNPEKPDLVTFALRGKAHGEAVGSLDALTSWTMHRFALEHEKAYKGLKCSNAACASEAWSYVPGLFIANDGNPPFYEADFLLFPICQKRALRQSTDKNA